MQIAWLEGGLRRHIAIKKGPLSLVVGVWLFRLIAVTPSFYSLGWLASSSRYRLSLFLHREKVFFCLYEVLWYIRFSLLFFNIVLNKMSP